MGTASAVGTSRLQYSPSKEYSLKELVDYSSLRGSCLTYEEQHTAVVVATDFGSFVFRLTDTVVQPLGQVAGLNVPVLPSKNMPSG